MKLFPVKGGVHPPKHKILAADEPIKTLPMPERLMLPMHQHIGKAVDPVVQVGQHVKKGQLLGSCVGSEICHSTISAPVHAPTSGTVTQVELLPSPHPSGLSELMVTIEPDGLDEWIELPGALDLEQSSSDELAVRIHQSGIVGLGGATFPSAIKLQARKTHELDTLILNGAECEPYLAADDRLMREQAPGIIGGILVLRRILNVPRVIVAIEDDKCEAYSAMRKAAVDYEHIQIVTVPTRYPMGSEKHLIKALTGKEVPAGGLPGNLGIIVNNVGTAFAVHQAVHDGQPLISRIVTVSGAAIKKPGNFEVLIGTPVSHLIDHCGGYIGQPAQVLSGGPMMGQPLPGLDVPIVKGTNGILALTKEELNPGIHRPCIRCASCVEACPCGLQPLEMAALVRAEKLEAAGEKGLHDCISCGACSYVCPSHIPLVQYFNYGKGRLMEIREETQMSTQLKRLSDERDERVLKQEAEKRAKAEARKKAIAARKAAAAKKEAEEAAQEAGSDGDKA